MTPEPQNDRYVKMNMTTPEAQNKRQRLSPDWEPKGFDRYLWQQAVTRAMPILGGGPSDRYQGPATRYRSASSCQETLECSCGGGEL